MHLIPIDSRQIAFIQYDDQTLRMIVYFHTGRTQAFPDVNPEEYASILTSSNRYDSLIKLASIHLQREDSHSL
jgi:hypothetical protein